MQDRVVQEQRGLLFNDEWRKGSVAILKSNGRKKQKQRETAGMSPHYLELESNLVKENWI